MPQDPLRRRDILHKRPGAEAGRGAAVRLVYLRVVATQQRLCGIDLLTSENSWERNAEFVFIIRLIEENTFRTNG